LKASNNSSGSSQLLDDQQDNDDSTEIVGGNDRFADLVQISREMAHQLNNLLTTILANVQLISLMLEDEELRPYIKPVEEATRDAGTIVSDFQNSVRALISATSHEQMPDRTHQSIP
jgi:signal transduction histidine kinase